MAVDTIGYRSKRGRNDGEKRAAKEKREKIILAVCGVVLLALLAFQGPKMLKRLHGTSSTAAAPAVTASPTAPPSGSPAATAHRSVDLGALKGLGSKDPFVAQLGTKVSNAPEPVTASPPAVRASHFVSKDPFAQQLSLTAPGPIPGDGSSPPPGETPSAGGSGNYIVVLASVPIADGHAAAARAAAAARSHGVANVSIVKSSSYPTLRTGFYAVYSGPYPSLKVLLPQLEKIRGEGYASAYTRRLAH